MPFKCPSPGTTLNNGRYKVIRELNTGGTAVVYEAYDYKKNRKCALKVSEHTTSSLEAYLNLIHLQVMNLTQRQFEVAMKLSRREVGAVRSHSRLSSHRVCLSLGAVLEHDSPR